MGYTVVYLFSDFNNFFKLKKEETDDARRREERMTQGEEKKV